MVTELNTAGAVIDALGGTGATARLVGKTPQHVSNWRADNRLPSYTFLVLTTALNERSLAAPPSLWGMATAEGAQ